MLDENYLEVYFDQYCRICKHCKKYGHEDPCNECLDSPTNLYSHKPINYEEED